MGFFSKLLGRTAKAASFPRTCNICGYQGRFQAAGKPKRIDAKCPKCGGAERYRLLVLWLDRNKDALAKASVIHFAPEKGLAPVLKARVAKYESADIVPGRADRVLNIEKLDIPDSSQDAFVCSHVLEHVNDTKALAEMFRVLKPGGLALIMVPVIEGWDTSYENPLVKTEDERARHYGQGDHVRWYGRDIRDRITGAGFQLSEFTAEGQDVLTYALQRGEKVFVARKP